jgi:hypothetical protein
MKINSILGVFYSVILISVFLIETSSAQITNTDTLDKGSSYGEINLWTGVQSHENGGQQVYGGRFSYGLKDGVEIGINASGSIPNDPEFAREIQPNIKFKFYNNKNKGVEAVAGVVAFVPVANREGTDTFAMTYANISKKAKYDTRFTAGFYALIARDKSFGTNKGVNLMVEKKLTEKAGLSLQWFSGKNRFGYVTGGASFQVGKKNSLFLGYSVGNYDYDNHGPVFSFGRYF